MSTIFCRVERFFLHYTLVKRDADMRPVRISFFLILSVFLLVTSIACYFLGIFCEPDEDCVTVYIINSSSREVDVHFLDCCESVSISPGHTGAISVLLGRVVSATGHSHVFHEQYEVWEIW